LASALGNHVNVKLVVSAQRHRWHEQGFGVASH
jgi:hypothetical protein